MPLLPFIVCIFFYQTSSSNLAIAIKGIKCKNVEHKISLYADDVLLFLQHLQTTFSEVNILINSVSFDKLVDFQFFLPFFFFLFFFTVDELVTSNNSPDIPHPCKLRFPSL